MHIRALFALFCLLHCLFAAALAARLINSNQHWTDTKGNRIEAHGGGFLFVKSESKYFWYGESLKNNDLGSHGVNAYSAPDLSGPWTFEGMVLKNKDITICCGPFVVERPKVLYNEATKLYVMWFHLDDGGYRSRNAGVATSSSPRGPFRFVKSVQPDGSNSLDLTLFQDDDGQAYLVRNVNTQYVAVSRLSADYLSTQGMLSTANNFEGMAMVRLPVSRQLYVIGSGLTGWWPNSMQMYRSKSGNLAKPDWQNEGNPTGSGSSFNSQPTFLWQMSDRCGQLYYIYMGDNWVNCGDLINACYVWLPFKVNEDGSRLVSIENRSQWDLDDPFNLYGSRDCPPRVQATDKCGAVVEGADLTLSCPLGGVISAVDFASFGQPTGVCNSLSTGSCHSDRSQAVVESACIGKPSCTVTASGSLFGDPCPGARKTLAAQVSCSTCDSAAQGDKVELSCGNATITGIGFASYGTPSGSCYTSQWSAGTCSASSSSSAVKNACVGKSSCSVAADSAVFGDPCPASRKKLAAQVSCSSCGSAGEKGSVTVSCSPGTLITNVAFASWGQPEGSCSTGFKQSTCHAASSMSVVRSKCVGKSSCTLSADNSAFNNEDPCAYQGKSLAVSVICGGDPVPVGQCVQVSESQTLNLQCASGKISRILSASYGQPGSDCAQGSCHASTSLSVVQAACVGKSACAVQATNSVFGDPCPGTGKSLAVSYTCA